ncbi:MAG: hypothetical protein WKH64_14305 [Chloroflexia bacterium]
MSTYVRPSSETPPLSIVGTSVSSIGWPTVRAGRAHQRYVESVEDHREGHTGDERVEDVGFCWMLTAAVSPFCAAGQSPLVAPGAGRSGFATAVGRSGLTWNSRGLAAAVGERSHRSGLRGLAADGGAVSPERPLAFAADGGAVSAGAASAPLPTGGVGGLEAEVGWPAGVPAPQAAMSGVSNTSTANINNQRCGIRFAIK